MAANAQRYCMFVIFILPIQCAVFVYACVPIRPPENGVIRCEQIAKQLVCTATCNKGFSFDTGDVAVKRVCNTDNGSWMNTNSTPTCKVLCNKYLISGNDVNTGDQFAASSSWTGQDGTYYGAGQSKLTATPSSGNGGGWRPQVDNLKQYVQVQLPHVSRINGIVTKGSQNTETDTTSDYVTLFRILYSLDGETFVPYGDEYVYDKFFHGNNDTDTAVVSMLSCPFDALYVRINPLEWQDHIGLRLDLIGCDVNQDAVDVAPPTWNPVTTFMTRPPDSGTLTVLPACEPLEPPIDGVVSCEETSTHLICTAVCKDGYQFIDTRTIIKHACDLGSHIWNTGKLYPQCYARPLQPIDSTKYPKNRNCITDQSDCHALGNGDFHACVDCHYFATCSEGYVYFRPCPDNLVFDARSRTCQYHSTTCNLSLG